MIDDHLASIALEARDALLRRNRGVVRANLRRLEHWVAGEPRIDWVKPRGGTVTLLSYRSSLPSRLFCERLLAETGTLLTPGSAFGLEGAVRIGFGNAEAALIAGLEGLSAFLARAPD
jgi:aspartate/methionine/tyrosine aminotransferase